MVEHRAIQQQRRNRRDEGDNVKHAEKTRHLPSRVHLVRPSSKTSLSFPRRAEHFGWKTAPLGHFLASDSETCSVLHTQMCNRGSLLGSWESCGHTAQCQWAGNVSRDQASPSCSARVASAVRRGPPPSPQQIQDT